MARYIGPKEKVERRLGKKLFLKGTRSYSSKSATVKRMYPPGPHGKNPMRKQSEFGVQLFAKQRVKKSYGMLEKQFKNLVKKAMQSKDKTLDTIVLLLEFRLDNVVYRAGLAQSRAQARQLVNHGHITVNSLKVSIPSAGVKKDDIIGVREGSKKSKYFTVSFPEWIKIYETPKWLLLDSSKPIAIVKGIPNLEDSGIDRGDLQATVELYSR